MKSSKKIALALGLLGIMALPVQAEEVTERECWTDSYGNTTCRDKTYNRETGVITYSDEVIVETITEDMIILNTGLPKFVTPVAALIVALGGISFLVKRRIA